MNVWWIYVMLVGIVFYLFLIDKGIHDRLDAIEYKIDILLMGVVEEGGDEDP